MRVLAALFLVCFAALPQEGFVPRAHDYLKQKAFERKFMGAVLVAQKGEILLERGYGYADAEWEVVNSPRGIFRLGSLSKQFTAAAVLQLAQNGKLKLADPIKLYYPDAPAAWEKVTVHHLLSHTSGIQNFTDLPQFSKPVLRHMEPGDLVASVRSLPLKFAPGAKWAYSNTGYVLLGMVIERVSGRKYGDYMRDSFFRPLGMNDSGLDTQTPVLKNRAHGYFFVAPDLIHAPYMDMSVAYSANGLYSTVQDLLKWDRALYTDIPLKKEWRDKMFTGYMDNPIEGKYGYAWFISKFSGKLRYGHEGTVSGFASTMARYPESEALVIILSNVQTQFVGAIGDNLARMLFGGPIIETMEQ